MKLSVVVALGVVVVSTPAHAAPDQDPQPAAFHPVPLEAAVRAGVHATKFDFFDGERYTESGMGPALELDLGFRVRPWLSIGAYGAYSSFHSADAPVDMTLIDFGLRSTSHLGSWFAGVGVGLELYQQSLDGGPSGGGFADSYLLLEGYAGYTFSRIHGVAPQGMVVVTRAADDQRSSSTNITSVRFLVGVQL